MKTIGFIKSTKENEFRRALTPIDIKKIKHPNQLFFENGYGEVLGFTNQQYLECGVTMLERDEILKQDIICDPKIGDADYLDIIPANRLLFGWVHAAQNRKLTDLLINKKMDVIAWEDMHDNGRHVFWRNNELAGEAAVLHAMSFFGKMPYDCNVAIIGRGNVARGAYRILNSLGATIQVYNRQSSPYLKKEIKKFDIIVNGVLWDSNSKDYILNRTHVKRMKKPSIIIDVSCDYDGAIETARPTTIEDPIYIEEGIMHYAVDHTPSLVYHTVSKSLSRQLYKYIDYLITDTVQESKCLKEAMIFSKGNILDERIKIKQKRS